jgi:hypothetical protein
MWDRLLAIDRRWIFLFVAVSLTIPFFLGLSCKSYVSPEVKALYAAIEELRPNSKVLVSFDYDPASAPELEKVSGRYFANCKDKKSAERSYDQGSAARITGEDARGKRGRGDGARARDPRARLHAVHDLRRAAPGRVRAVSP